MSEQEKKLKLIEEDLKSKALEIDDREKLVSNKEKSLDSKLHIVDKEELFLSITKSINDIFSIYEASTGSTDGCNQLINYLASAKSDIEKLMNK